MAKIVIVGGVAGGASCAARLRRQDETAEITILEKGPYVSFANCGLPYYIGNVIQQEDELLIADTALFEERFRIDARVLHEVTGIDRANKTVTVHDLKSGETYDEPYDQLVLSPGAIPIRPPFPGIDIPGIFTIRSVPDSNQVKSWIEMHHVDRAVVIGGGFIGLEMAENLVHRDIKVNLIERDQQIMPVLDREMTAPVVEAIEKNGIGVLLGDSVTSFEQTDVDIKVHTEAGRSIRADMVILAIGVTPDSALARDAGLELSGSGHIVVNARLQTSDPDIYAVGDAIEVTHAITGQPCVLPLAGPANRQGRIAADVISGRERSFRGVQGTAVCGLFDVTLAATGLSEKQLEGSEIDYSAIYAHPNDHVGYYPGATPISMKLLFDNSNGRVLGAQAVGKKGAERRIDVIAMAIQNGATVYDLEEAELCYAPQFGAAKDPVNILGMIGSNIMRGDLRITPWEEIGKAGAIILDVRSYSEIAVSPIVNQGEVKHIPLNELRDRLEELNRDTPIHVSCAVGARANNAVRLLNHRGFDASLLPGGTLTLACLNYCSDDGGRTTRATPARFDPLVALHEAVSPLSGLPLWLLQEIKADGILKEYSLGQSESVTLKASAISDILVLGNGEIDVIEFDQVSRHLSSTESKRRPVKLSSHESKTFYARTPSTLYRIDQEYLDFFGSWFAMVENLAQERPDLEAILGDMRRPSVFMNLPLSNVQEALKLTTVIEARAGDEIITQGDTPDNFYIIIDGAADVHEVGLLSDDGAKLVNQMVSGDHFGEDAFVIEGTRSATVTLTRDSTLLALDGEDFKRLISQPLDDHVDHNTAKIQVDQGLKKLLDVRYEEEWYEERIPGATLIPLPELRTRMSELDKDQDYIVYCHAGKRSAVADLILKNNGFNSAWMLEGIREWPYAVEKGL